MGVNGLVVEYQSCYFQIAVEVSASSFSDNLEQLVNLLSAQANLASFPNRSGSLRAMG